MVVWERSASGREAHAAREGGGCASPRIGPTRVDRARERGAFKDERWISIFSGPGRSRTTSASRGAEEGEPDGVEMVTRATDNSCASICDGEREEANR